MILFLCFVIGTGCATPTVRQTCQSEFVELEKELRVASENFEISTLDRRVASSVENVQLQMWQEWAQDWLIKVQKYIDVIESEPARDGAANARMELHHLANNLVAFYGFSLEHKETKMRAVMNLIRSQAPQLRQLACRH